jgi:hypothetical protein
VVSTVWRGAARETEEICAYVLAHRAMVVITPLKFWWV